MGGLFRRRKGAGDSVVAAAYLVVAESLALPSLTAPLLRRAQVRLRETANTGYRRIFFRRARCPHRAVPGRPGVPPLQRGPKPDSISGTGDREGRPYIHLPKTWRAGEDTRPYGIYKSCPFFVGAGPRPARGRGTPQGGFSRPSADSPSAPPLRISRTPSAFG